jgi:dihydroneopterin aldolase
MDKIWIKDLEIFAYHGVLAEEKRNGQKFYVTVSMDVDLHAECRRCHRSTSLREYEAGSYAQRGHSEGDWCQRSFLLPGV